jgi:hypothetical protein
MWVYAAQRMHAGDRLGISTATANLLDRLTASGRLTRSPHPRDRRSLVVRATKHAPGRPGSRWAQARANGADRRSGAEDCQPAVAGSLSAMAEQLDRAGMVAPLTRAAER